MKFIIVGCGRVGALLATNLDESGHDVTIIDKAERSLARLGRSFRGTSIHGNAFSQRVLEDAGIDRADGLAAVTNGDNTNYVIATLARSRYRVPRIVARIYDPLRADIYRELGIPTVSSTTWGANRISEILTYVELTPVLELASGEVLVVEAEVSSLLAGHTVRELNIPEVTQVVALVRAGRGLIPSPALMLAAHDKLQIATLASALPTLNGLLGL